MYLVITFIILIFSAIIHEVAHGVVAGWFGDDTAEQAGRITLNPLPHIDPVGTILVPLLIYFGSGGRFWFGSAKPVPVDFDSLHPRRLGMAAVSFAGPASNFLLAVVFTGVFKLDLLGPAGQTVSMMVIFINLLLGTFNLIPIPPLDGSKIVLSLFSDRVTYRFLQIERFGFVLVLAFVYLGLFGYVLNPVVGVYFAVFHIDPGALSSALGN